MGALVVAAWLVEAKQSVIENMAPVLTACSRAIHRCAAGFSGNDGVDRRRHRRETESADRLRPVVGRGPRPAALRGLGARLRAPPDAFDALQCYSWSAPWWSTPWRSLRSRPASPNSDSAPTRWLRWRESDPVRQPLMVGVALCAFPFRSRLVRRSDAMANRLPARIRRVGSARGGCVPSAVRYV